MNTTCCAACVPPCRQQPHDLFTDSLDLWGLFASSFISSTLLPGGSEVVLGYLVNTATYPVWLLLLVATLGNGLGAA